MDCFRVEFGQLAIENKPVNLGQGFPDMPPPESVAKPLREAVKKDGDIMMHQYARGFVSVPMDANGVRRSIGCYCQC